MGASATASTERVLPRRFEQLHHRSWKFLMLSKRLSSLKTQDQRDKLASLEQQATNSKGKVRAIVNDKTFEQAIHQEICLSSRTLRCAGECGCEQKYKWHRLLAYDPNNDCSGIFMDWFLFPSCCSCRCRKNPFQTIRT